MLDVTMRDGTYAGYCDCNLGDCVQCAYRLGWTAGQKQGYQSGVFDGWDVGYVDGRRSGHGGGLLPLSEAKARAARAKIAKAAIEIEGEGS